MHPVSESDYVGAVFCGRARRPMGGFVAVVLWTDLRAERPAVVVESEVCQGVGNRFFTLNALWSCRD